MVASCGTKVDACGAMFAAREPPLRQIISTD